MRKAIKIILIFVVVVIITLVVLSFIFGPLTKEEATMAIENSLEKYVDKNDGIDNTMLRIHSQDYSEAFAVGVDGDGQPVDINCRYHSASIGKTFTTVLFYMLQEEGLLDLNDPIIKYLSEDMLEGLFVYEGIDFKEQVTIRMLINHTSGVGDYFEGPVVKGEKLLDIVEKDLNKFWTSNELIDFTRDNQRAVGIPGEQFSYSDTGYILLGKIIEVVEVKAFHEVLYERILEPLDMRDSNLTFKSKPMTADDKKMLPILVKGIDYSEKNALSLDWSGGGIVTTTDDLLKFMKALHEGELIEEVSLDEMKKFDLTYDKGIYYGMGMMSFEFSELSPLLFNMSSMYGGVGSTASFMLYDEVGDVYIIMNVGNSEFVEDSVSKIVEIRMILERIQK